MAKKTISPNTQETILELTGKFGPKGFLSKLFGGSKKQKEVDFSGKAKIIKDTGKASKINPLPGNSDLNDMLMKIYSFLQKNSEDDKLYHQKENNFKEEDSLEDEKRHQKLLAALSELKKNLMVPTGDTSVVTPQPNTFLDTITDFLGGARAVTVLRSIGSALLGSPLALGLAGAAALGAFVGYVLPAVRERDKELFPENYVNVPSEIAAKEGITNKQAGAQNQRKAVGGTMRYPAVVEMLKANPEALSEMTGMTIPELNDWVSSSKPKDILSWTPMSERKKATPVPSGYQSEAQQQEDGNGGTPSMPAPAAMAPPNSGEQLNEVVAQNNDAKINAMAPPASESTINNVVTAGSSASKTMEKLDVPHVRNQEATFQNMIIYSTRLV